MIYTLKKNGPIKELLSDNGSINKSRIKKKKKKIIAVEIEQVIYLFFVGKTVMLTSIIIRV